MTEIIRYIIDLEPKQVKQAAELLTGAGIGFDPVENMIAMPPDNMEEGIFTGREGEWVQERINEYLHEADEIHRLVQPFHEMTLTAQRDLLTLATLHCDWSREEIHEMNRQAWNAFRKTRPETVGYRQPREVSR